MREERLLNMIGEVNENYIMEADPETGIVNKISAWIKLVAIAACLCIVFVMGGVIARFGITNDSSNNIVPLSVAAAELGMEEYTFGVALPDIVYADSEKVIMYDFRGIYVYDIAKCELIGFSDFRPIEMTLIQGDNPTHVLVSSDGTMIRFFNNTKKYLYNTEKNETIEVDSYEEQFEEYSIKQLPYGDPNSLSDVQLTYLGGDGSVVSLDLRYDNEIVRYRNLILLIKVDDHVKEYEIFK